MLRYALRRVLWAIPTLFATSLVLFLVTTLARPDATHGHDATGRLPSTGPSETDSAPLHAAETPQARFLDLPRFVNPIPGDVRSLAREAIAHVAGGDREAEASARELQRLGGAALPYVLPMLEALAPDARRRVSVALGPIALRMGIRAEGDLESPEFATVFWTRFWDDRAVDFTRVAAERAVRRLVDHGSEAREEDVVLLDTLALPEILRAMSPALPAPTLARLTRLAQHATERGPVVSPGASADDLRRAVADWREWWFERSTDFMAIDGLERMTAVITDTQYGKWLKRIAAGELGVSVIDGQPIADKLRARAPVTAVLCGLATLLSWLVAVPLGAVGGWRRGSRFDVVSSGLMFLLYATPSFAVAEALRRLAPAAVAGHLAYAVVALAAGSMATLSRWQRTAMLEVVRQDFVRTARAKGMLGWRVMVVHALRNALMPTVTVAGLHLPTLLGSAVVVEEVFGLRGIGFETMRAIEAHDVAWLMAVLIAMAAAVTLGLLASDLAYGALDPRVRDVLITRQTRMGT